MLLVEKIEFIGHLQVSGNSLVSAQVILRQHLDMLILIKIQMIQTNLMQLSKSITQYGRRLFDRRNETRTEIMAKF